MSEPTRVRLKRKATEDAPNVLVVQSRGKRAATNLHYVRQPSKNEAVEGAQRASRERNEKEPKKRVFELSGRKRKIGKGDVVTVVEKRNKGEQVARHDSDDVPQFEARTETSFKRPSRRAAVSQAEQGSRPAQSDADRKHVEELAAYMHQAALEEITREATLKATQRQDPRPSPVAAPRLSGQRSKQLHEKRTAANGDHLGASIATTPQDTHMADDSEYVYDTYILAPTSDATIDHADATTSYDGIGYLVITEADEALWETYMEEEAAPDKDWNNDEEEDDENAEDYYGADYPEHELDSEDEFDRDAYGYRRHGGSDDEEWDQDAAAFSDDDQDGFGQVDNHLGYKKLMRQLAGNAAKDEESD